MIGSTHQHAIKAAPRGLGDGPQAVALKRYCLAACVFVLACAAQARADALVFSDFSTDADGWNAVSITSTGTVGLTSVVTWNATGGNPDGHISRTDPQSGSTFYFNAPSKFLGDVSAVYGGTLSYDVRTTTGTLFNSADVRLVGGASPLTLVFDAAAQPTSAWTSFLIPFSEGQWRVGSLTGAFATSQQIMDVLAALTSLRIRGEYVNGSETGRLDNVALNTPEPVPEPATLALMGTGLAGLGFYARRRRALRRARTSRPGRHAYAEPSWVSM